MSSEKQLNIAYVLALACLVIGIVCYAFIHPVPADEPVRIHFKSVGGNVLFDHQAHVETYEIDCAACHHASNSEETALFTSCTSCHQAQEGPLSFGENGLFDHDMHIDADLDCVSCHHDYSEDSEEEPRPCRECHTKTGDGESELSAREVFHLQCISCHEENDITPGGTDCSQCHVPRKKMAAFHDGCIGCHEEQESGPTGADGDCVHCHGY